MKQLSSKVLQKVAEELNDFLDITPRISTKSTDEVLREKILEAAGLLVVDGKVNEMLELSKTTQKVISYLQSHVDTEEEEEEEEEKPAPKKAAAKPKAPSEQQIIEDMDLDELKSHIKANKDVFVTACKGVNFAKEVGSLRAKALKDIGVDAPEKEEDEAPKKPAIEPMTKFVEALMLKGGDIDEIAAICAAECEKRGILSYKTAGQVRAHWKYAHARGLPVELVGNTFKISK